MTFLIEVATTTFYEVEASNRREAEAKALEKVNNEYPKLDWGLDENFG